MGFGFKRGGGGGYRGGGRGGRRPGGPRLPGEILGRLRTAPGGASGARGSAQALSRKEERKAARQAKKQHRFLGQGGGRGGGSGGGGGRDDGEDYDDDEAPPVLEPIPGQKRKRAGTDSEVARPAKRARLDPAVASAALARGYDLDPAHAKAARAAAASSGRVSASRPPPRRSAAAQSESEASDDDEDVLSDIEEDEVPGAVDLRGRGGSASSATAKKPSFLMADAGDDDADIHMIRDLERKLGIKRGGRGEDGEEDPAASKKNRKALDKLNREFAKDGLGDDFGDFLDGLDGILGEDDDGSEAGSDGGEDEDDGALGDLPTDVEDEEDEEDEAGNGTGSDEDEEAENDEEEELGAEHDEDEDGEEGQDSEGEEYGSEAYSSEEGEEQGSDAQDEEDEVGEGEEDDSPSPSSSDEDESDEAAPDPVPAPAPGPGKYVPPHLRRAAAAAAAGGSADADASATASSAPRAKPSLYGDNEVGGAAGTGRRSLDPAVQASALASSADSEAVRAVRRRVQGLMNRLGESNIEPIAQELAGLYRTHATADCNAAIMGIMLDACASEVQVLRPLVRIFAALLSALHILVGPVVGAHALEWVTLKFADAAALPRDPNPSEADLVMSADDLVALGDKAPVKPASSGNALADLLGDGSGARSAGASTSKLRNNLLLLLGYLYVFQVTYSDLFTGVLRLLVTRFSEPDVELLLLALTHIGFQLRNDDPVALRDVLRAVQTKASAAAEAEAGSASAAAARSGGFASSDGTLSSLVATFAPRAAASAPSAASEGSDTSARMRIMMELVLDIKNNRKRVEHEQMLERGAQLRKWLGRLASKTTGVEGMERRLRLTWSDLMLIPQRGRWWLVGASWVGRAAAGAGSLAAEPTRLGKAGGVFDEVAGAGGGGGGAGGAGAGADAARLASMSATDAKLWALAKDMRMNTAARKSVFVAVMGAEDVESALDRVLRLGLKGPAERDIVRVLLDCCGQEQAYNSYYALVGAKLCAYHHRFKFTFQLAFWDAFKSFEDSGDDAGAATPRRVYNLARMFADMVRAFSLALTVLKPLDITGITADVKRHAKAALFLKAAFTSLFIDVVATHDLAAIFTRLGAGPDKLPLRDALLVFLHNHVPVKTIVAAQTARPRDAAAADEAPDAGFYTSQRKAVLKAMESVQGDRPEDGL